MQRPIPPQTITEMKTNYSEWLPKVGRVQTAYLESRREPAARSLRGARAHRRPPKRQLRRLASAFPRTKARPAGATAGGFCYRAGDYGPPTTTHHPERSLRPARHTEQHFTFATRGSPAARADLRAARSGLNGAGGAVAAPSAASPRTDLPFWHYTTPLRGQARSHRRSAPLGAVGRSLGGEAPKRSVAGESPSPPPPCEERGQIATSRIIEGEGALGARPRLPTLEAPAVTAFSPSPRKR